MNDIARIHVARPGAGELQDLAGHSFQRYGEGTTYLIRPDQHVTAAFRAPEAAAVRAARDRALARLEEPEMTDIGIVSAPPATSSMPRFSKRIRTFRPRIARG